jgi:hypothetical protein
MIGFDMREGRTKCEHWQRSVRQKIGSFKLQQNPRTLWFSIHSYFLHNTWESLLVSQRTNLLLRLSIASCEHKVLRLGPPTVSTSRKRGDYDNQILVITQKEPTPRQCLTSWVKKEIHNLFLISHSRIAPWLWGIPTIELVDVRIDPLNLC